MRRYASLLIAFPLLLGAAPSRINTYTNGDVIDPNDVTENEDAIFSYLQAGVDVVANNAVTTAAIAAGTITASDISSSAAIAFSQLASLTSGRIIVGNGSNVATSVALSGDATLSSAGALTIAANSVDGTNIALGSDAQGDVMYYNGTDYVRRAAGSNGALFKTSGASGNPTWESGNIVDFSRTAVAGSGAQAITGMGYKASGLIFICGDATGDYISTGLGDNSADEASVERDGNATNAVSSTTNVISIGPVGTDVMTAVLTSVDTDGFTITWTKNGSGRDVNCYAMGW